MTHQTPDPTMCSRFQERLQYLLDERLNPGTDKLISEHARDCQTCRASLNTWLKLQSLYSTNFDSTETIPIAKTRPRSKPFATSIVSTATAIAAAIAFVLFALQPDTSTSQPQQSRFASVSQMQENVSDSIEVDQTRQAGDWWRSMQDRDWMAETMPGVHSVRQGVAPLGRSLMQAMAILTQASGSQTS